MAKPRTRKIGYIVNAFPLISETFLINELRALQHGGVAAVVFPLSDHADRLRHAALDELSIERFGPARRTLGGWLQTLRAHIRGIACQRRRYFALLRSDLITPALAVLRRPHRSNVRQLAKRAGLFMATVRIADRSARVGVVHVHAHYAKEPLDVAKRVHALQGIPFSFAAHAKDLYTSPRRRLRRRLRKARFAVTCHRHGYKRLRRIAEPGDEKKVLRVFHGLDIDIFKPTAEPRDPRLILAVGRLTPKKGFDVLIHACALLAREGEDFRCVIVGQGRLGPQLESLIDRLGLRQRVEIRGYARQRDIARWYRRAAVVALPARVLAGGNRDGIPNVLVESMATGTPVVSTPVGGIPELVVDGKNGRLVPPDRAAALAAALGDLIRDPAYARRLGREAANAKAVKDFRATNQPLVDRFRTLVTTDIAEAIVRVDAAAWRPGGLAQRAEGSLGVKPKRHPAIERSIARAIQPGLEANAWRPDVERMIGKRLWDEVYKARRLESMRLLPEPRSRPESRLQPKSNGRQVGAALKVLDVGCGRGGLTVALRARDIDAFALDVRPRNCRTTRQRGRRYGQEIPACTGVGEALPFGDKSFDLVCMFELLEHVQDPELLLREAHRVCRPDGRCVVTVVNRWAHLDPHYHLWGINFIPRKLAHGYIELRQRSKTSWRDNQTLGDMHYFSFRRFSRLASALGFDVLDLERPDALLRGALHRLSRQASLGFNTAVVVLTPR